jgi:two-component system, sensor histidine kinase and response regulator
LRQVFLNLVGNAVKFTDHGAVTVKVARDHEAEGIVTLRVSVEDTGIGISEEGQRRLFQPFSQADASTTRRHGGTGLGLVISKVLVQQMGGTIGVRSQPKVGSEFWFTVRLPKAAAQPEAQTLPSGHRTLVAIGSAPVRSVVAEMLTGLGSSVDVVGSTDDALVAADAATTAYDALIVDRRVGADDGPTLVHDLRSRSATKLARAIVLVSVTDGLAGAPRALDELVTVTKPVIESDLLKALVDEAYGRPAAVAPKAHQEEGARGSVLIVEDNATGAEVASLTLQKLGYRTDVATNGREALDALAREPYDAVLMDCQMPEMDGYEATRELRRRENGGKRTPVLALTAHAMSGERERCFAAGMDDFLTKPIIRDDLAQALDRWIRGANPAPMASGDPTG